MDVDLVFTGLCSFLNLRDTNDKMPEPSVILVQSSEPAIPDDHGPDHSQHKHIPFIAFEDKNVDVDDRTDFKVVPQSPPHVFMELDGVELTIDKHPPGKPTVPRNYEKRVVRRDDYWPEATNEFDPAYVPKRGGKPQKSAVKAFLRFGTGTFSFGRDATVDWVFTKKNGKTHRGRFTEEVVYSFKHPDEFVTITLSDLDTGKTRALRFSPRVKGARLRLNIGNNMEEDMDNAVQSKPPSRVEEGDHFKFLNRAAGLRDNGPIPDIDPKPVPKPATAKPNPGTGRGGGGVGGACGPNNGNS